MPIEGADAHNYSRTTLPSGDPAQTERSGKTESKAKLSTGQSVTNETKSGNKLKAKLSGIFDKIKTASQSNHALKNEELNTDEMTDFLTKMETGGRGAMELQKDFTSWNTKAFGADEMIRKFDFADGQGLLQVCNSAMSAIPEHNHDAVGKSVEALKKLVDFCANPKADNAPDLKELKAIAQEAENAVAGSGDMLSMTITGYVNVNIDRAIRETS